MIRMVFFREIPLTWKFLRADPIHWWGAFGGWVACRLSRTALAHMAVVVGQETAIEVGVDGTFTYEYGDWLIARSHRIHGYFEIPTTAGVPRVDLPIGPRKTHIILFSLGHLLHLLTRGRFRWWQCTSPAIVILRDMGMPVTTPCSLPSDIWRQLHDAGFDYRRITRPHGAPA